MIVPTVAIRHPLAPDVRMIINASEYVEGEHVLWPEPQAATEVPVEATAVTSLPSDDPRVQRGARGLWFVRRDGQSVGSGYKTQVEAEAAMAELAA